MPERVDERREDEDVEARVQQPREEPRPEADDGAEQAEPDAESEESAGEKRAIEPIRAEVGSERLEGLGVARLPGCTRR